MKAAILLIQPNWSTRKQFRSDHIMMTMIDTPTVASLEYCSPPEAVTAAFNIDAHPYANEASPAALPKKLNQPHVYEHSGEYCAGTTCALQW